MTTYLLAIAWLLLCGMFAREEMKTRKAERMVKRASWRAR